MVHKSYYLCDICAERMKDQSVYRSEPEKESFDICPSCDAKVRRFIEQTRNPTTKKKSSLFNRIRWWFRSRTG